MPFVLTSSSFSPDGRIPKAYTGDGADGSPALAWHDCPPGTRSLVLTVVDEDDPGGGFHHWTLANIPPDLGALPAGFPGAAPLGHMRELDNGFGHQGYGGPLPPHGDGPHRYVFTLYALSTDTIELGPGETPDALILRLAPLVLGQTRLVGTYER